jgi:small subunit ribosomal protein S4
MARYIGPKVKVSRTFGEPILGVGKALDKKGYPPGQHGQTRKKKQLSEYGVQLKEKQKAKHIYGLLERQFARFYGEASRKKGVTGENLLKLLESRIDNTLYRLGVASTRRQGRQMVNHKQITINGKVVGIPSYTLKPGDVIGVKPNAKVTGLVQDNISKKGAKFAWLEWNSDTLKGTFLAFPEKDQIPENIKEQLIVELYSK